MAVVLGRKPGGAGGGGSQPSVATYDFTAAEISRTRSVITEVIPGVAGKIIVPLGGFLDYKVGADPFTTTNGIGLGLAYNVGNRDWIYGAEFAVAVDEDDNGPFEGAESQLIVLNESTATGRNYIRSGVAGEGLYFVSENQPGAVGGAILTIDDAVVAGGTGYGVGDTGDVGRGPATYEVLTATESFAITAAVSVAKTFTVAGDHAAVFPNASLFLVSGSTGNDGEYTVASAVFGAGSTVITVVEVVADETADGYCTTATSAALTVSITDAGAGYAAGIYPSQASSGAGGDNMTLEVLTASAITTGTARLTIPYVLVDVLT